jgi:large exoprotein involved in heme utilization and adhesion
VNVSGQGGLSVAASGTGSSGNLTITTPRLTLQGGAKIAASTVSGRGGDIRLEGLDTLEMHHGLISASTASGIAGDVTVNASNSVLLSDQSRLSVEATNGGRAGNLTINTGDFRVLEDSEVSVSSPLGIAGNLNVNAGSIGLNRGSLTAKAGQGEGGANINLNLTGFLRLDNESLISAEAIDKATGGNINISAQYILASFPTGPQGSDIIANAVLGNGGKININALGIFGIQFRPLRTPFNDITASSQAGASGTVQLTTLGIDPSRGLAALPLNFVDASGLVGGQCSARNSADGEQSQFTITGRGGLPLNPTDPLSPDAEQVHWVSLDSQANWVSLNPEAATQMRITPFNSAANLRQLAQFPVLCYQSWLSPTTKAQ